MLCLVWTKKTIQRRINIDNERKIFYNKYNRRGDLNMDIGPIIYLIFFVVLTLVLIWYTIKVTTEHVLKTRQEIKTIKKNNNSKKKSTKKKK